MFYSSGVPVRVLQTDDVVVLSDINQSASESEVSKMGVYSSVNLKVILRHRT